MKRKLFLVVLIFFSTSFVISQTVNLNFEKVKLEKVMAEIQNQTGYTFSYSNQVINTEQIVSINVENEKLATTLEQLFGNLNINYEISANNKILLKYNKQKPDGEQQTITIKGKVSDSKETIVGASVVVKNTNNGTMTDIDGNFTLSNVPGNAIIVISYIGYQTQELPANSDFSNIIMREDNQELDEIVVVGYGVQKKSDLTGSVSQIKADDLKKNPSSNPINSLQGRVAGVNITKSGGAPGSGSTITIRGIGTVGNNSPLYIIDGIPGDMSMLNPDDISSIEILKDGAAAAIYGSRAANGVVLITTKKGKEGDISVDFNTHIGFKSVIDQFDLLDSKGYNKVHKMMYDNYNKYASSPSPVPAYVSAPINASTDWQKEVTRANALQQNYSLNINGGNKIAYYGLSGSWTDEKGTLIGSQFLKKTLRAKLGMTKGNFSIDANVSYAETDLEKAKFSLWETYKLTPLISPYKNGKPMMTYGDMPANANPFADIDNKKGEDKLNYLSLNVTAKYKFTDYLSYQANLGYIHSNSRLWNYHPKYMLSPKHEEDWVYFSENRNKYSYQIMEHLLNFNKEFGKSSVSAVVGYTASKATNYWLEGSAEGKKTIYSIENGKLVTKDNPGGFLDPNWKTINAGQGGTFDAKGSNDLYTRTSILGRINYSYDRKYLVQLTARRDGSSKFGADTRYGIFPSVALGWRISEENFMSNITFIDNLKLRASWGKLGNEVTLGLYDHQALISTGTTFDIGAVRGAGATPWTGSIAQGLENRDLQWETTISKNIGLDFGFIDSKISGSLNYYVSNTQDMLIVRQLPGSAGMNNPVLNVGEIQNRGIELELGYSKYDGEFTYSIVGTLTTIKNEVIKLADKDQALFGEGLKYGEAHFPTQTRVGHEIGAFFLYETDGLFQSMSEVNAHKNSKGVLLQPEAKPGDIRFVDTNNDGVIDVKDRIYQGSGIPDITYSLSFNAAYKGFDFSIMFYGVAGNKIYNGNRYRLEGMAAGKNFLSTTLNAWTENNRNTDMPRAVLGDPNQNLRASDRFLESGSFVRLKNIELGYSVPQNLLKKVSVNKLRIYVNTQNVFTITNYSGIDPEIGRGDVLNIGIDKSFYPINRAFFGGIQLSF